MDLKDQLKIAQDGMLALSHVFHLRETELVRDLRTEKVKSNDYQRALGLTVECLNKERKVSEGLRGDAQRLLGLLNEESYAGSLLEGAVKAQEEVEGKLRDRLRQMHNEGVETEARLCTTVVEQRKEISLLKQAVDIYSNRVKQLEAMVSRRDGLLARAGVDLGEKC